MGRLTPRAAGSSGLRGSAVALVLALVLAGLGCARGELRAMPGPLLGKWTSADPRYVGRSVEIRPTRVVLRDLGRPIDRYHIERIRRIEGRQGDVYELHCVTDEGLRDELRLTLVADQPAYLKVGEAPVRWTRSRAP